LTLATLLALAAPAHAQSAGDESQKKAAATVLFDEGKEAAKAGDLPRACAKFEASIAVLPQLGTRLNLADCYEKTGRLASAWAEFREAASLASKRGESAREDFAREHVTALEPRLSRLTIKLAPALHTVELRVTRDGVVVLPALLDTAVPVDTGTHVVSASAP